MCFQLKTKDGKLPLPKIATKDITVYKSIGINGNGWMYNLVIKRKFEKWTKGYEYEETTPFIDYERYAGCYINIDGHCFHSCIKKEDAFEKLSFDCHDMIQEFIIPKGALYYKNEIEYVSNRLIYPEQ